MANSIEIDVPDIYTSYYNDNKPYQIWKGSRFSAKSWTKALFFLLKCRGGEYFRLVYARDTQKNVRKSQYQLFMDIAKKFGLYNEFDFRGTDMQITHKLSGYFMIGGSFEQPDTLRSVADVTDFWAEEPITRTFSIDRESFLDISGSLRNSYGVVPKFHFTFNPIGKKNFIYEDFFSDKRIYPDDMVTILHSNYTDNPFCPQDRIDFLNQLKKTDISRWYVDGNGDWGESKNDDPYFFAFDKKKHLGTVEHMTHFETIVTFDFNINPATCSVIQYSLGSFVHVLKSYRLENTTLEDLCKRLVVDYPNALFRVTGDPSGNARHASNSNVNDNLYTIIKRVLRLSGLQVDQPRFKLMGDEKWREGRILCNLVMQNHPNVIFNEGTTKELVHEIEIARPEEGKDKLYKTAGPTEYGMNLVDGWMYFCLTYLVDYIKY